VEVENTEDSSIICEFPFTCSQSPDFGTSQVRLTEGHTGKLGKNALSSSICHHS
jgi:hypothetical protein